MAEGGVSSGSSPVRVLMVCLGNICRSPTAKVVLQRLVEEGGAEVEVDSCGTGNWHVGEEAHSDTVAAARKRGYDLSSHRARALERADAERFDYIVAMDKSNLRNTRQKFRGIPGVDAKLSLLCSHAPDIDAEEVPDPYYEGGFDKVIDICEAGCKGLLKHIQENKESRV